MKLSVDHEADALYLNLSEDRAVESEEIAPGIILDYDADNRVVGIEMLNLSRRAPAADTYRLVLQGVEATASLSNVLREEPPQYGT
jgi:uncharacterized protein YuzE